MAKGYLVVTYRAINDQDKWSAYAKLAGPAIQKAGGRFIVRGMPAKTYEKGMSQRVVIVEFESVQKASEALKTNLLVPGLVTGLPPTLYGAIDRYRIDAAVAFVGALRDRVGP